MAWAWLTKSERAARRKKERDRAQALSEELTFGGDASEFKAAMDKRAMQEFNKLAKNRIDPRKAPLDEIAKLSRHMASVITALQEKPHTAIELSRRVAQDCDVIPQTARRYVHTMTSILIAADRVKRDGKNLELS